MPLPLPLGTVLQNRYYLIDLLGQGESGRTYLAKDQERSNALCVLKELKPKGATGSPVSGEQLRERASHLYRIEHPQIPQYRTTFEEDGHLFLVRDYVEGTSYRSLLSLRTAAGGALSEAEVLQLLQKVLPVLNFLHEMGIAHGNILPENIILPAQHSEGSRSQTGLPVLIELAAEKELASSQTAAGKPQQDLLAPSGAASPNSDLYSLALTAIVLLTGKNAADLTDSSGKVGDWQQIAPVSPKFAEILNRMLSDRTSAGDVPAKQALPEQRRLKVPTPKGRQPVLNRPNWPISWAFAITAGLVLAVGAGSWGVLNLVFNPGKPSPLATSSRLGLAPPEPVDLAPNQTAAVEGSVRANETRTYSISGLFGQQLSASATGTGVSVTVLNPNSQPINDPKVPAQSWKGGLFASGDYSIQVRPVKGVSQSQYKLEISLSEYFPRKLCQEPEGGGAGTWYPVLVEYSPDTLKRVQSGYCRDTFIVFGGEASETFIQVASFANRFQAQAFADSIAGAAGRAKVGPPAAGSPRRSCSNPDPGGATARYPVLVEYSKEKYVQILSYCPNASVRQGGEDRAYIEVAAFANRSLAVELAAFITKEVGSASVGEATTDRL
ncbi:serine/threonine protein kinase [Kamptonema formosum]|uniref:serine/threonine protein kinase n=1 Tax=Kamptonema formosum TaxID=331992 RepID=UPI000346A524|nr:protein kinase [Oscillatoria sp. PCC 10802]